MKKLLLIAVIWVSYAATAYSQTAANYYNTGKSLSDKASDMLSKMSVFDKATNDKIIDLYKQSAASYLNAEKEMSGLKYHANYCASVSLYKAAIQYHAESEDTRAYETMKQVLDLWPDLKSLSSSRVCREKSISRGGYVYIYPAADSIPGWSKNYYMSRYLLSILSVKQNLPDDALKYAEDVADNFKADPAITEQMAYFAATALHKAGNTCDAGKYAVVDIENVSQIPLKDNDPAMGTKNKHLAEMVGDVVAGDSLKCVKNKNSVECISILASLQSPWKINPHPVYNLGESLFANGTHSFKLIFSEYKLAMTQGDSTVAHLWDGRLDEYRRHFSSTDWRTLAAFYDNYLTKAHLRDDAIKMADKKVLQEATHVLIGVEPTLIPLGQYAAAIQVMGKYVSHEFRFGFINNGIKPYLKGGSDTEKVPLYLLTHYNGLQLSYSFKVLTKGEYNPNAYSYLGAEFRYTMRNYTDPLTYYVVKDTAEHFNNVNLKTTAAAYDATLLFGEIIKGKVLFFEIFGGVGVGYKTIKYGNPDFNPSVDAVANAPFKADVWNKIYVPIRFGIKVGFVL